MQNTNQNGQINMGIHGEIIISKGDMLMVKIKLQSDENSDFLYTVVENYKNHLFVAGVGLTVNDAIHNAIRWACEIKDVQVIEKVKALVMAYQRGEEQ